MFRSINTLTNQHQSDGEKRKKRIIAWCKKKQRKSLRRKKNMNFPPWREVNWKLLVCVCVCAKSFVELQLNENISSIYLSINSIQIKSSQVKCVCFELRDLAKKKVQHQKKNKIIKKKKEEYSICACFIRILDEKWMKNCLERKTSFHNEC